MSSDEPCCHPTVHQGLVDSQAAQDLDFQGDSGGAPIG